MIILLFIMISDTWAIISDTVISVASLHHQTVAGNYRCWRWIQQTAGPKSSIEVYLAPYDVVAVDRDYHIGDRGIEE